MMTDYAKMYELLFQAIDRACGLIELEDIEGATLVLKQAQLLTEIIYIESSEDFGYDPERYTINRILFDSAQN